MSLIQQVVATIYLFAVAGRWSDIKEYIAILREVLNTPVMDIRIGSPVDKEI